MTIISICFPWDLLFQTLCLLLSDDNGSLQATGQLPLDEEVLIDIFCDLLVMRLDDILGFDDVLGEAGTVGVVEVDLAGTQRLDQTRTAVEV
jgi:hypothetical protein